MSTKDQTLNERAMAWHAPQCEVDAGGACVLHADEKEAWMAGEPATAIVADGTDLGAARPSNSDYSEPPDLQAVIDALCDQAQMRHLFGNDKNYKDDQT